MSCALNQLKQPWTLLALLLRHQQCETVVLRESRPAGAEVIASRVLTTAMQHHHERRRRRALRRHVGEHFQIARVRTKPFDFSQRAAWTRPQIAWIVPETRDSVQLA